MIAAVEQGLIFALLALGVFLTYRILNLPDLTVDGSFTTGGGTAAIMIFNGLDPYLATVCGFVAGAIGGLITGLLHTKLKIDGLLASILTMIALYSINLRVMWGPNISLNLRPDDANPGHSIPVVDIFTPLKEAGLLYSWELIGILAVIVAVVLVLLYWFLNTNFGLAVQATGDNPGMALANGISTDRTKIVTLMLSNGLVGLSGAFYVQFNGAADIQMGVGMILVGLASVIVGNAILGTRFMFLATLGSVIGSLLYRLIIFWALSWEIQVGDVSLTTSPGDMKLISAVLVVLALALSKAEWLRKTFNALSPWREKPGVPEPMADPALKAPLPLSSPGTDDMIAEVDADA
ncbi:MAG: ABC transporter permease [Propionibacteriaceae bacterium]|jgi:putative ABC transport system permease protein|nr:ABC transporter permease [Propionibacteriaceae bacterium]